MHISILGSGHCLPAGHLSSDEIDRRAGRPAGWLSAACGVISRPVAGPESQIDLAVGAAQAALAQAGLDAGAVDLLISACGIPYQTLPATAPLLQRRLGIADGQAAAFDVNSTCLSFVTALDLAARQIAAGQARHALIVSSEIASRALPWNDQPDVAGLFGDGAGAVVIGADRRTRIIASHMRTFPSAYEACEIGAGGTRFDFRREAEAFAAHSLFRMDGKALFKISARHFGGFVDELLAAAGWRHPDVDCLVPHQASPAAPAHLSSRVGFRPEQLIDISRDHGNQIAASIPIALDIARRSGRIGPGKRVLLVGTSAGVSFGGLALVA